MDQSLKAVPSCTPVQGGGGKEKEEAAAMGASVTPGAVGVSPSLRRAESSQALTDLYSQVRSLSSAQSSWIIFAGVSSPSLLASQVCGWTQRMSAVKTPEHLTALTYCPRESGKNIPCIFSCDQQCDRQRYSKGIAGKVALK